MATQEEYRNEDAGGIFRITCKKGSVILPIDHATIKKLIFEKKDDTVLIVDGVYPAGGDGTDGQLEYTFLPTQINVEGEWKGQAFIKFSDYEYYFSSIVSFKIGKNLATLAQVIATE